MAEAAASGSQERTRRVMSRAERAAQFRARAAELEALDKQERRKLDTRRKVIIGGMILAALDDDPELADRVRALLRNRVTRENDRKAIADLL